MHMEFGNKILTLRKQHHLTQEKLASEMGISIAAVSKWETGNAMPDLVMLCALADFFQVTTDELLGRNKTESFIICDDAKIVREALYGIIKKEGYQTIALAENGRQLLDAAEKETPSVILLDITLPDTDGFVLLQKIKAQHPGTKVIMVTADSSDKTKNRAIELGADAYITKPFLPEHIRLALTACIG